MKFVIILGFTMIWSIVNARSNKRAIMVVQRNVFQKKISISVFITAESLVTVSAIFISETSRPCANCFTPGVVIPWSPMGF